jgi:hypothetical protein
MTSLFLAALLASAPQGPAPAAGDVACYRLMAELARAEDPAVRALGLGAAQYFLGRIDAAAPGHDPAAAATPAVSERPELLRRCSAVLEASGFDPRSLGETLERPPPDA